MLDGRDQAEGLRKMLSTGLTRTIAVFSARPGCGATTIAVNLAAALAACGRRVLLVDEHFGPGNAAGLLGARSGLELRHALTGESSLSSVIRVWPSGLMLLPAAAGARALGRMSPSARGQAVDALGIADAWCDVVVVDALAPATGCHALLGAVTQETLIVLQPDPVSITQAYVLMKRLRRDYGIERFRVLLNRASARSRADRAAANLTQAARGFLEAELDYAGSVPREDDRVIEAAARSQPLVEAAAGSEAATALKALARAALNWPAAPGGADSPARLFRKSLHHGGVYRTAAGG